MQCNALGIAIIKEFEGCRLTAYQDGNGIWTLGWGETGGIKEGDNCTQEEADAWLAKAISNIEHGVTRMLKRPLDDNQFSALCSLVYNIGLGHFAASSVLQLINADMMSQVPVAIFKWCRIAGEVSPGLLRRRKAEIALWSTS